MEDSEIKRKNMKRFNPDDKKITDKSGMILGKIPPQARDLEEAVLGALMIDKNVLGDVVDVLKSDTFYVEAHGLIYKAIAKLFEQSKPVDILTVMEQLKQNGDLEAAGGAQYLSELTNRVASSAHSEYHARIIVQKYVQRELIRVSNEIIRDAFEDTTDVFELLDNAEKNLFKITDQNLRGDNKDMGQLVAKAVIEIGEIRESDGSTTGIPSGYTELDRITGGWQKTDLLIIAGRPGMGKTAFILGMTRNAAIDHKKPIAIFSLEMGAIQLTKRLISSECEIEAEKIKTGNLKDHEWAELNKKVEKLSAAPIYIVDTPAINIFELRAQCRRLKSQYDIQMVIIDYLQLMSGTTENKGATREQEISNISRALKSLAKELDIPVIALSQLSRAVETRGGDKRPQLSDLRESGAIEQDADMVMFLYRPEYYEKYEDEEGNSTKGVAEVIIAKHRNGPTGKVRLRFIDHLAKYDNLGGFDDYYNNSIHSQSTNSEQQRVVTLKSKINDDKGEDFDLF